ncbi:SusC/RagA family TonB-linked outer membrane protein [Bacteroidia bacterium]|nr:SusC/RagA family TonB-linked outer membrane protein [Bacteroidia bacterium]
MKNYSKFLFIVMYVFAVLLIPSNAFAQNIQVNGIITDLTGEPIIGASVVERGTTNGIGTDIDGNYSLSVAPNAVLKISYIGYITQEIAVGNRTTINVQLVENAKDIEEVIVVGYGTQRKADLTSAISTLNPTEVLKAPGGIENALQGNVAGVNVSGGKIRIRGTSSITGTTDPLWIIDGIIGSSSDVPNEDQIASIQILKDAASAAIYGVRGANGVIVVTTKRGQEGAPRINFNTYVGTGTQQKKLTVLNAYDYAVYANELYYNAATPEARANGNWADLVPARNAKPGQQEYNTDWWDEFFFDNVYQKYDLSISGASKVFNYNLGTTYTSDQRQGVARGNETQNIFATVEGTKGRLTYGGRIRLNYNRSKGTATGSLQNILQSAPNIPVRDPAYKDINNGYYNAMGDHDDGIDIPNQAFFINEDRNRSKAWSGQTNVFTQIKILDWLNFKLNYNYSFFSNFNENFRPRFTLDSGGGGGVQNYNLLETGSNRNWRQQVEGLLNYNKQFGQHSLSGVVGLVSEVFGSNSSTFSGRSQEQTDFGVAQVFQDNVTGSGTRSDEAYYSVLARLMYNYAGKYMFTGNFRADESSKFAPGNRWGYFPSFSIGWRIKEEAWMKDSSPWLNDLKLRATLGWIGSSMGVGNYSYQNVVSVSGYTYSFGPQTLNMGDTSVPAPRPSSIANKELSWEKTRDTGAGFDLATFNNRLSITFDYYNRKVSDMLLNVRLPYSVGVATSVTQNVGSMTNQGLELSATWRDKKGDFTYAISPNFSLYRNKVNDMGPLDVLTGGNLRNSGSTNVTRTVVGKPVAQYWGLKTDGLFQTDAEAAAYVNSKGERLQPSAKAGDLKYVNLNGDDVINDDDRTYIGSSIPDLSVGLNIALGYKGFDFSMLLQGDLGIGVYNNFKQTLLAGKALHNQLDDIKNAFRAEDVTFTTRGGETINLPKNTNTTIPRIVYGDPNDNSMRISDYFVEDASYIRCNNITLGYTFPKQLIQKVMVEHLRLYIGAKNPFTITKYSMFDPQVPNGGSTLDRGVDGRFYDFTGTFWSQREYFAGLQLTF